MNYKLILFTMMDDQKKKVTSGIKKYLLTIGKKYKRKLKNIHIYHFST